MGVNMKKLFSLALVVLTAALVNSVFAFAKYVDITTTYAGNDVTYFPVLVKVTSTTPSGFYSDVKNGGADLKFTDANGVGDYPYEIDTWNAGGDSYIWVRLPKLAAGMTFRMYYGDAERTQPTNPSSSVWSGYAGVWHLKEAVDATERDVYNGNHTTSFIPDTFSVSDAPVGVGRGAPPENPTAVMSSKVWADNAPIQLSSKSVFAVSFWWRPTVPLSSWSSAYPWKSLVRAGNTSNGPWGITPTGNVRQLRIDISKGPLTYTIPEDECAEGVWGLYTAVFEGKSVRFYLNGTLRGSSDNYAAEPFWGWTGYLGWGGSVSPDGSDGSDAHDGVGGDFDECRFYDGVLDADRVAADYQTMANVATFLEFGDPQIDAPTVTVLPQGVIFR